MYDNSQFEIFRIRRLVAQIVTGHIDLLVRGRGAVPRVNRGLQFKALSIIIALFLSSCDNSNGDAFMRSGMMSAMRLDSSPLAIRLGQQYFTVPASCSESAFESRDQDGTYVAGDTALFQFIMPDLTCKSKTNIEEFRKAGEDAPLIRLFMSRYGSGVHPDEALKNMLLLKTLGHDDLIRNTVKSLPSALGEEHYTFFREEFTTAGIHAQKYDMIKSVDDNSFVYCMESRQVNGHPKAAYRGGPSVSICKHYFNKSGLLITLTYGRGWLSQHREIRLKVAQWLDLHTNSNLER